MREMKTRLLAIIMPILLAAAFSSCEKHTGYGWSDGDEEFDYSYERARQDAVQRKESDETRRVLLLYLAGFNNLSAYMNVNMEDLESGFIPGESRNENVLLIYSHTTPELFNYNKFGTPYLIRLTKNKNGEIIKDTLETYPKTTISASSETFANVLSQVKELFPAKSYGALISTHGTGWLPAGYYSGTYAKPMSAGEMPCQTGFEGPFYHIERDISGDEFPVKSIGLDQIGLNAYEMDLKKFAAAIPFELDYIILDACLMGCVEVAYELKDKCRFLGISPTEILSRGFNYEKLSERLLGSKDADVEGACEDYFEQYNSASSGQYATISYVDCSKLEPLADVCKGIFSKHREELKAINPSAVQGYFRFDRHFFYDLRDMLMQINLSESEIAEFDKALEACVPYKAATKTFMEITINTYCGLSCYMPCNGAEDLDTYYEDLAWNKATSLVE